VIYIIKVAIPLSFSMKSNKKWEQLIGPKISDSKFVLFIWHDVGVFPHVFVTFPSKIVKTGPNVLVPLESLNISTHY